MKEEGFRDKGVQRMDDLSSNVLLPAKTELHIHTDTQTLCDRCFCVPDMSRSYFIPKSKGRKKTFPVFRSIKIFVIVTLF